MTLLDSPTHSERKRLGQYFTGPALSRLLAELADAASASRVIDPMAGSGDLLVAAHERGGGVRRLDAVEIDPRAADACRRRLITDAPHALVRAANAFDPRAWREFAGEQWDLVITNPPYVRYQRGSSESLGDIAMPSAQQVRSGVIAILEARQALPDADRRVWRRIAEEYGGLSDLAVPAWILCASLVAPGGRLAIVAPDTWLSRDYALPVLYLLRRYFEIEAVIEDGDASWFPDALVRTTLLVARRVEDLGSGLRERGISYPHVHLDSGTATALSVVGELYEDYDDPERAFVSDLRLGSAGRASVAIRVAGRTRCVPESHLRSLVLARTGSARWLAELEAADGKAFPPPGSSSRGVHLPFGIAQAIGLASAGAFASLDELGWQVGQGLRTGANRFFYCTAVGGDVDSEIVEVDAWLSDTPLQIPRQLLAPVVRKQQDLGDGAVVTVSPGRVLLLAGHALAEDIERARRHGVAAAFQPLIGAAAHLVRRGAQMPVGSGDRERRVPELSAVVTNVRCADPNRPDRKPRYWYHLPPFAPRHEPELFMPRVNHLSPVAVLNRSMVVDANFSTLSPAKPTPLAAPALVALLNSSWVAAVLELSGTVLGGGALKVEATHLRSLPLPRLSGTESASLHRVGELLACAGTNPVQLRFAVDVVLEPALERLGASDESTAALRQVVTDRLGRRNPRASGSAIS